MKNLNFADPEVVSKQEILANLKEHPHFKNAEIIEWLDSITNDIALSLDEADVIYELLGITDKHPLKQCSISKLDLLFNMFFFPDPFIIRVFNPPIDIEMNSGLSKRFFRTDLLDDERIKCIPLFFKKIGDKETFDPSVGVQIETIRDCCSQNKEFAKAYQAKLAEIRNANGSLQERLAFYVELNVDSREIDELEQPTIEMFKECINGNTSFDLDYRLSSHFYPDMAAASHLESHGGLLKLLFSSLMQTPDGIQIPRWNEENYLCRMLLDHAIIYSFDIADKLFRDCTTTNVALIICNHLKWRNDNMPQSPVKMYGEDLENHRKEYAKSLRAQLPELFSSDISHKYSDILHEHFVRNVHSSIQFRALLFLNHYLTRRITLTIIENNHEQFLEISRLFDNENNGWLEKEMHHLEQQLLSYSDEEDFFRKYDISLKMKHRITLAMEFFKSDDPTKGLENILKTPATSEYDNFFLGSLLVSLMKDLKDKNPSLTLEDFMQKYIPLEIFPTFFCGSSLIEEQMVMGIVYFFQEQNEDVYQNMKKQYPSLSRQDALLARLLPYFTALAIKAPDKMLSMLGQKPVYYYQEGEENTSSRWEHISPKWQLFLCVLNHLCERHEKEPELIALIFEIVFKGINCVPVILDIIKKYPQVQQLVFKHCYTILNRAWDTPICTPISSCQIQTISPALIIGMHKGAWHGLKPLLIAFRKTRMEWVDVGLSDYYLHPNGNSNLVEEIEQYFSSFQDLLLKDLRQDITNGLSDWLKPLPESKKGDLKKRLAEFPEIEQNREGFDITYTEPDPIWRYAYVRAIADLGVDVDGKGHYIHSVMDMVAKKDPSEMVRKAAKKTSEKLKAFRNGWDEDEHFRKIRRAFWWIKQASRLALNLPIDIKSSLEARNNREPKNLALYKEKIRKKRAREREEGERKKQQEMEKLMRARLRI